MIIFPGDVIVNNACHGLILVTEVRDGYVRGWRTDSRGETYSTTVGDAETCDYWFEEGIWTLITGDGR